MRNPKKCIVFLPRQRRQCKSTKASKAEGREGEEFFPAILGEICAGHGRMYVEGKDLQFIEDDETAVGSEVGERAESPTGGTEVATEGELEASIDAQSSHASIDGHPYNDRPNSAPTPTVDQYYFNPPDSVDANMSAPANMSGPAGHTYSASRHPHNGHDIERSGGDGEVVAKIIGTLEDIKQEHNTTHGRLAAIEQFLRTGLVQQQQGTIDTLGEMARNIQELNSKAAQPAPDNGGANLSLDRHVASKLEELSKLHHGLEERQKRGFATVTGQMSDLQRQRKSDAKVYQDGVTDLTTQLEGLKITVQQKDAEEAKANKT
ncbi:MAG: hypothetical protein Q9180_009540, partial [Flavoplaca navasiana]